MPEPAFLAPAWDVSLSLFGAVWATGVLELPEGARVLEIGCAEGDWQTPMLANRPDLRITGIDWRDCDRPWTGATNIRGDVLTHDFPDASVDAVVCVSSIEHIGLGYYDADPLDVDGDERCMARVRRWLRPGGVAALQARLLVGLTERWRGYATRVEGGRVLHAAPVGSEGLEYVAVVATCP